MHIPFNIKIGNIIFDQDRDDVPLKLKATQCILIIAKAKTPNVVNTNGSQHVTKSNFCTRYHYLTINKDVFK